MYKHCFLTKLWFSSTLLLLDTILLRFLWIKNIPKSGKYINHSKPPALTLSIVSVLEVLTLVSAAVCSEREKRRWLSGVKMLAVMCLSAATKACLCRVHTDGASSFVCSVSHVADSELPGLALWAWLQA